jgi:predicted lipase
MLEYVWTLYVHQNSKVLVTGHSLGAAMATLAAVDLANAGYDTDLITFGSPRVGNKAFSEYVNNTVNGVNLRVTHGNDIVTVFPPQLTGYHHVGREVHYIDPSTMYKLPPNTDVKRIRLSGRDHKKEFYKDLH